MQRRLLISEVPGSNHLMSGPTFGTIHKTVRVAFKVYGKQSTVVIN